MNRNHLIALLAIPAMTASAFAADSVDKAPLKVGDSIPALSVKDQDGKPVDLGTAGAKGLVLVYFYPKADTGGCTAQGCSLRDGWTELAGRKVTVYGVSTDSVADQKKFKDKYHFPFSLLADTDKAVTKAFQGGSLSVAIGYSKRQAYLFEDGKCIMTDYKGHTADQSQQVLKFLDARKK